MNTPLKPLHAETSLTRTKLTFFKKLSTEELKASLMPGQQHCLKTRPDGTMLDGHHRVHILKERNENVDLLPREVLEVDSFDSTF
jgi:hypothetical protein